MRRRCAFYRSRNWRTSCENKSWAPVPIPTMMIARIPTKKTATRRRVMGAGAAPALGARGREEVFWLQIGLALAARDLRCSMTVRPYSSTAALALRRPGYILCDKSAGHLPGSCSPLRSRNPLCGGGLLMARQVDSKMRFMTSQRCSFTIVRTEFPQETQIPGS